MFLICEVLLAFLATLFASAVLFYKWSFSFWRRHGFEQLDPIIPFGNCTELFTSKCSFSEQFTHFYREFKRKGINHGGVYILFQPYYLPTDPDIIKDILQKNSSHFMNRGFYVNEEVDILTFNLFFMDGNAKWKNLRNKLGPAFTPGKMKMMFDTVTGCATELENVISQYANTQEPIDIKETLAFFAIDIISSCFYGLETNSLKNPNTEFRRLAKRTFENTTWETLKTFFQHIVPDKFLKTIRFKVMKPDVEEYFFNVIKQTVEYREKNHISQKDFLHLLLELKNKGKLTNEEMVDEDDTTKEITLSIKEVAGLVFGFFAAGYETSSTTMAFALYELSRNQNLQNKLRGEIDSILAKHDFLTYEAVMEMTYMDQIIYETLRKYPALGYLNRQCTKTYKIPNTNLHIEKGTLVVIPVAGLHHDPEYYSQPSKFDPERFSDENKNDRVPFTWLPFGEGPRMCIGLRFGMLLTKICLITLLKKYKFQLSSKTQTPLVIDKKNFFLSCKTGIWLNVSQLNGML